VIGWSYPHLPTPVELHQNAFWDTLQTVTLYAHLLVATNSAENNPKMHKTLWITTKI